MNGKGTIAINEERLSTLTTALEEDIFALAKILDNMENCICFSNEFASEDVGIIIREKFAKISTAFPEIKKNMNSYITDLRQNIINYNHSDEVGKSIINTGRRTL